MEVVDMRIKDLVMALGLSSTAALAASAQLASAETLTQNGETTTVWKVEMRGKPPYARQRVEVPVVNAARLEVADEGAVETVKVWTIDRSGKPPYRRQLEELPVSDVAAMQVEAENVEDVKFRGRPPFNRHR
jgi:hypothetical protein